MSTLANDLQAFLAENDSSNSWGGLQRIIMDEQQVVWVCGTCAQPAEAPGDDVTALKAAAPDESPVKLAEAKQGGAAKTLGVRSRWCF